MTASTNFPNPWCPVIQLHWFWLKSKIKSKINTKQNQISWLISSQSISPQFPTSISSSSSVSRIHFLMTILLMIRNLINCFISILVSNKIFMLIESIFCLIRWIFMMWWMHSVNKCFEICCELHRFVHFSLWKISWFFHLIKFFEMIESIRV